MPKATARDLPDLLHDATLVGGEYRAKQRSLSLRFNALRRGRDESSLCEEPVEVVLRDVQAIAVAHDSWKLAERPTTYVVPEHARIDALVPWPLGTSDISLSIDSKEDLAGVVEAARTKWLVGSLRIGQSARLRVCLHIDRCDVVVRIWIAATDVKARAGGRSLSFSTWATQYGAWWKGWKTHWEAKSAGDGAAQEDAFIPVADGTPDASYVPPDEPRFALERTNAPRVLVEALRAWFTRKRDPSDDSGRWGYARAIDAWWVEGNRAYTSVRGIEHGMPLDEDTPAENVESVWELRLQRRNGRWVVVTWSQGWPPYGSAPKKTPREKPWLKRWRSGKVKS